MGHRHRGWAGTLSVLTTVLRVLAADKRIYRLSGVCRANEPVVVLVGRVHGSSEQTLEKMRCGLRSLQ